MQEQAGAPLSATEPPEPDPAEPSGPTGAPDSTEPAHARQGPARRTVLLWYVLAALVVYLIDQGSKAWAVRALDDGQVTPLIGDLLSLRLIRNSGAAFSIGDSMTWLMTLIAVAVTVAILVVAPRIGSSRWSLSLGLLLGGSLGNLYDRFFREPGPMHGHVIDFIDYGGLFVGNVADIAIVLGALLLLWLVFTNIDMDGTRPKHVAGAPDDAEGRPEEGTDG